MIKHFINLQWKQFFRSSYWQKNLALNILLVFFALYFLVSFLALGVALFPLLNEAFPNSDPFVKLQDFMFYWLLADVVLRFFFQKLPVMSVKPLLTLPIKRKKVVNYVLAKSALSFFNVLPLFAALPFAVMLFAEGYPAVQVVTWVVLVVLFTFIINFVNFIIETFSAETELSFLPILAVVSGLFALDYFGIISFSEVVSKGILFIVNQPVLLIVPVLILAGLYRFNFKLLKNKLYTDASVKTKTKEVKTTNLDWTRRFGDVAPFVQLDLKLIMRNKRPRSAVFILVLGLLYGLIFYPNPTYSDMPWMFVFVGVFVTGIFLMNFGQFVPAWDGSYYKLLMSQNTSYKNYLKSKFLLMALSVGVMFLLSTPYVYFGIDILLAHLAAGIYNLGVNTHVVLFAGAFNRKPIELDKSAAFNYQGTGAVQWLLGIPLFLLPMGIFILFYFLMNFEAGLIALSAFGLIGLALHQRLMKLITDKYQQTKHKMIAAFGEK